MAEIILANIALSGLPYGIDKLYTYEIPSALQERVQIGVRVLVPFGRGNRRTEGMVLALREGGPGLRTKRIEKVLDEAPLLDDAAIQLLHFIRARCFCTYYEAVKMLLPSGVWFRYREYYRLCDGVSCETAMASVEAGSVEEKMLSVIAEHKKTELSQLSELAGELTQKKLKALEERGLIVHETSVIQRVNDKTLHIARLIVSPEEAMAAVEKVRKRAPARYAATELLCAEREIAVPDITYYTGASLATLRKLESAGIIELIETEQYRVPVYEKSGQETEITLNAEQQNVFDALYRRLQERKASVTLLHGVTASGKTQVYIRLIRETLAMGRNALMLVPEIALTPQMMARFTACFGDAVSLLHSGLRLSERYDQWKRISRGEVRVVLGTRSAVFAPLPDLGLIVMDEEHEPSYQSENTPHYHARDIALYRCWQSGALLLLGSATPTIESMYHANTGRYGLLKLRERYHARPLPRVDIVDMRQELRRGNDGLISEPLRREIEENIARGEQSILFLNRRGNSRMLLCGECGTVPECPRCSVPMTYHSANDRLMCHYCGYTQPSVQLCPQCGGYMKNVGAGTQKAEEELHTLFPDAEVMRMDADTVGATHRHAEYLQRFERERVPLLLGTQMIAKGLDFANVTLVGVLAADQSLFVNSYHAAERSFHLIAQVVGRAGRGEKNGRAIIQSFVPEHNVIRSAAAQDYESFYQDELRMRNLRSYPPFTDLFTIQVTGAFEERVIRGITQLRDALCHRAMGQDARDASMEIFGPAPATVLRVNNRYRYCLYISCRKDGTVRRILCDYLRRFGTIRENRGLSIYIDCNAPQ